MFIFLQHSKPSGTTPSEIYMEIKGAGIKKILNIIPDTTPSRVIINNYPQEYIREEYYLSSSYINIIIIQWDYLVTNCAEMFYKIDALTIIDLSKFDSSRVSNMMGMFYGCHSLTSITFGNFDTSLVEDMSSMFCSCPVLITLDLKSFNTPLLKSTSKMFFEAFSLTKIDLHSFNTSLIVDMSYMFYRCEQLKNLSLKSFKTPSLRNMDFMFYGCRILNSLDLSSFNTSFVNSFRSVFNGCEYLTSLDISIFNTNLITNMDYIFYNCKSLRTLNLNSFNTSSVTSMEGMFSHCNYLSILNIDNFDTSSVTNMIEMFYDCTSLESLNLNHFKTSSVVNMKLMFYGCVKLKSIELNSFDTSSVIDISKMFSKCKSLISLNLYNFNINSINSKNITNFSLDINKDTIYCINEKLGEKLISELQSSNPNYVNNCSQLCLINSQKFLPEEGICNNINKTHKFEYNNYLYKSCPNDTYIRIDNNLTCYKEPDGYYLDLDDNIYKSCYPTCKKCKELGNETDHKCLECYNNYTLIKDFNYNNCFVICNYYYYFDFNYNYHCSKTNKCLDENDKLIKEKNKCIDKCYNDDTYKYEYNDECHSSCPNGTYISTDNPYKCQKNLEGYYLKNNTYIPCYYSCKNCYDVGDEINHKCIECYSNYILIYDINNYSNCYKVCDYYYYFDSNHNYYCTKSDECPNEYNKLIEKKNKCTNNCSNDKTYKYEYNNKCYKSCPNNTQISSNNFDLCEINKIKQYKYNETDLLNKITKSNNNSLSDKDNAIKIIKHELFSGTLDSLLSNVIAGEKKDIFINDENIIYQITTSDNQNNDNYNISSIKLGECETILKNNYNISENETLLILKMDYFEEGLLIPIIEYEIYSSKTKEKLNLSPCKDIKINISIPVNINEDVLYKYNLSSDYYNDICCISNENGVDITLNRRKKEFNSNNMSLCESSCEYIRYDLDTKNVLCKCEPKNSISLISELVINENKLLNNFIDLKNSLNINIIKCYRVLFTKEGLIYNIGSYVILTIILINILSLIIFIIKGYNLSKKMVKTIVTQKTQIKKGKKIHNRNIKKEHNNNHNTKKIKKNYPPKRYHNKNKKVMINIVGINDNNYGKSNTKIELKSSENIINSKKKKENKMNDTMAYKLNKNNGTNKSNNSQSIVYYNDYELNNLTYEEALKYDHRNYFNYYFSLIKQKQLLIFSFYTYTDYNSKIIKISLFFFSFALYYTINALFFTDSTMNKIYETDGAFNFIYQIPQILYSSIISNIINTLITYLALSEKRIAKLRNENRISKEKVNHLLKCVLIKFIFYYILTFLFLIIFWYYLSCFGVVYKNTQMHLIKDTLISFCLTLFYPFGINLIPGIFRISALINNKKEREFLYKVSKILQLI